MNKILPILLSGLLFAASGQIVVASPAPSYAAADEELTIYPNEVTEATALWDFDEALFDISFKAPTTGYYYEDGSWQSKTTSLSSIDKITVSLSEGYGSATVIETFDNPAPGEIYSFKYKDVEKGKRYTFKIAVTLGSQTSYGYTLYDCLAGGVPAEITDVEVAVTKGGLPVIVTFTAPKTYSGRDLPLQSIERIRLYSDEYSYETWSQVVTERGEIAPAIPGEKYTMTIDDPSLSNGSYSWYLESYTSDGPSQRSQVAFYLGPDTPDVPGSVHAAEQADGTILITWEAPVKGSRNGYIDPSELTYTILMQKSTDQWGSETLKSDISECRYVYTPDFEEPTLLTFMVRAQNPTGYSGDAKSNQVSAGPAFELPFADTFNTDGGYYSTADHLWVNSTTSAEPYPPTWRYDRRIYVSNNEVLPRSGEGGLAYINFYSSTANGDYSLGTPKINVAGVDYLDVEFCYYHTPVNDTRLTAEISFDNKNFTPVYTADFSVEAATGWTDVAKTVAVEAGADFAYLRFTATKCGDKTEPVSIDEVTVKKGEAPIPVYPASVSDFKVDYNKASGSIDISFKAPLLSHASLGEVNGQPLEYISRIDLSRQIGYGNDYVVIKSFESPAPGSELSYSDTDLENGGEYYYKVVVYVDNYCDYGEYIDKPVFVGQIPVDVNDLVITSNKGVAPAILKFTAPSVDVDGEPLEKIVRILVSRYNTETFVWDELPALEEGVVPGAKLEYKDANVLTDCTYQYRVTVVGTAGNSYGTIGMVYIGMDEPLRPENVVAAVDADGNVTVTWDAPVAGVNDGYVDTENLVYSILRGNGYSDYTATPIASGIKGTSFTDKTKYDQEEAVKYFVKADNHGVVGSGGISNVVLVGDPCTLPFIENFDSTTSEGYVTADHSTWTMTSTELTSTWAFASLAYFMMEGQITPVDGGKGLAYSYYGIAGTNERDDYLTSGNINVAGADKPELTFYVYGVPGYETSLEVLASADGGEFNSLRKFDYTKDFAEEGWQKVTLPLALPENSSTARIQFLAHKGSYACSVAIDNIRIEDAGSGVESIAGGNVAVRATDGCISVSGAADEDTVGIFTLSGATVCVAKGDCSVPVGAGIYIVKVGNAKVAKVIVK